MKEGEREEWKEKERKKEIKGKEREERRRERRKRDEGREGGEERGRNEERRCIIVQRKNTFNNKFSRAEVQTNLKNNNFNTFLLNILQKDCTLFI